MREVTGRTGISCVENDPKHRFLILVKTIWQAEKEIDLFKFYYESKLLLNNARVAIRQLTDIPYSGNLLIQGTVGQGKSIFMRYLVSTELIKGEALPIFVQLMRIGAGESVMHHVLRELKSLGVPMDLG